MKRRSILGVTGALVATMAITGSAFAAVIFDNGSFENGDFVQTIPGLDFDRLNAGSTDLTGWTVTGGGVDWIGSYWQASAGSSRSLDLDGAEAVAPGGVSQIIPTKVNSTYVVTFDMSGNPDDAANQPALKEMTVAATGAAPQTFAYDISTHSNTRADMKWASQAYTFKATSTSTTLSFTSQTQGGYGPALDNVSITETLATGADCKKGGWQNMVDLNGTHFRNQGDCVSYYATGEKNLAY